MAGLVLQPAKTNLRDRTELSCIRRSAAFLEQRGGPLRHGVVDLVFVRLNKLERDQSPAHRALCFQCGLLSFVRKCFILFQRLEFFSARREDGCCRHARILAVWVWTSAFRNLGVNICRFVFTAESLKASRLEIPRRERNRGLLGSPSRPMKKRQRGGVVFVGERHLRERESCRPGEFAIAVIVQHLLQVGASIRFAMQVSITFA